MSAAAPSSLHDFTVKNIDGEQVGSKLKLANFKVKLNGLVQNTKSLHDFTVKNIDGKQVGSQSRLVDF